MTLRRSESFGGSVRGLRRKIHVAIAKTLRESARAIPPRSQVEGAWYSALLDFLIVALHKQAACHVFLTNNG